MLLLRGRAAAATCHRLACRLSRGCRLYRVLTQLRRRAAASAATSQSAKPFTVWRTQLLGASGQRAALAASCSTAAKKYSSQRTERACTADQRRCECCTDHLTAAASKQPAVTAAALWQAQDTVAPGAALCGAAAQFIAKGRRTRSDAFRLLQSSHREAIGEDLLHAKLGHKHVSTASQLYQQHASGHYSCILRAREISPQEHLQQRWGAAAAASAAAAAGTAHSRGSTSDSELAATKQRLLGLTRPVQQTARTMLSAATAEAAVAGRTTV
eukprot:11659-Heterococcus_DN1.PRE.3